MDKLLVTLLMPLASGDMFRNYPFSEAYMSSRALPGSASRQPSPEFLQASLDALAAWVVILDGAGRILFANRSWLDHAAATDDYLAACAVWERENVRCPTSDLPRPGSAARPASTHHKDTMQRTGRPTRPAPGTAALQLTAFDRAA